VSHEATNWAIKQRGLKPATKIVLWHLCDRYHPDHGCFPSQETLADDCEMSRSTLNEHLNRLEWGGLLSRVQRSDKKTHRQKSTLYILGFQPEFTRNVEKPCPKSGHGTDEEQTQKPCPETGHGAVSGKSPKPCPDFSQSRVRNPDTNSVREPVREPVCSADADPHTKIGFSETGEVADAFDEFWEAHPRPIDIQKTRAAFIAAVEAGTDPTVIIAGARAFAAEQDGNDPKFVKSSALWLKDKRWADHKPKQGGKVSTREDTARLWAGIILQDGYVPANAVNNAMRADIVALGLMTNQQLTERGFA
jgi:flagellar biosynthesis regulator FlaF